MKKRVLVPVVLLVIGLFILAGVLSYQIFVKYGYDKNSRELSLDIIPAALQTWDPDTLVENGHHTFFLGLTEDDWFRYFEKLRSSLGQLQSLQSIEGGTNMPSFSDEVQPATANYIIRAEFENGSADVEFQLIRIQELWSFTGFRVVSPLLAD